MRPDRLTLNLRPRDGFEAIDLGFVLARTHARELWRAWLVFALPVLVLAATIEHLLPSGHRLAGVVMWWAKPLCDGALLLVLSRAVFGERLGSRALLRELRRLGGTLFASLTLRRLSLSRSFLLPAHLLEGLRGDARTRRINLLREETTASARLLTLTCLGLELGALIGIFALVFWFTPELYQEDLLERLMSPQGHTELLAWQLMYLAAMSLLEPFYVAAGFALYLNRRTVLEGWDIEVALKRVQARLGAPGARP